VLKLRATHPCWGGRKIARRVQSLNQPVVPAPSTITAILRRHGAIDPAASAAHRPFTRFEHAAPNQLWQMHFKGHFACGQGRCHPLTVLDDYARFALGDHARFALCLAACGDQRGATVQARLVPISSATACPRASSSTMKAPGRPLGRRAARPLHAAHGVAVAPGRVGHARPYHPQPSHRNKGISRPIEVLVQKCSRGLALVFSVLCLDRLGGVFQDVVDPQRSQGSFA
jgi:transposase InsO family protein